MSPIEVRVVVSPETGVGDGPSAQHVVEASSGVGSGATGDADDAGPAPALHGLEFAVERSADQQALDGGAAPAGAVRPGESSVAGAADVDVTSTGEVMDAGAAPSAPDGPADVGRDDR